MPLGERPPLLAYVEAPELHICVLWGVEYVMPYFTHATPEDEKVLNFVRNFRKGQLSTTVKVLSEWLDIRNATALLEEELTRALSSTFPGAA